MTDVSDFPIGTKVRLTKPGTYDGNRDHGFTAGTEGVVVNPAEFGATPREFAVIVRVKDAHMFGGSPTHELWTDIDCLEEWPPGVTEDEVQAAIASIASVNVSQKVKEIAETLPPEPVVYMAMWVEVQGDSEFPDTIGVYTSSAVAEEAVAEHALNVGFVGPLIWEASPAKSKDIEGRISQDFVAPFQGFFAVLRCAVLDEPRIWDVPEEEGGEVS